MAENITAGGESSVGSESLTPGEMAYFTSRGADTSGLDLELGTSTSADNQPQVGAPAQETPPAVSEPAGAESDGADTSAPAETSATPDAADTTDGEDDEAIVIGKDGKPRAPNGRFVPHGALHAERERRKSVETELQTTREKMARADERLAVLNDIIGAGEKSADPGTTQEAASAVDPETDPIGALQAALREITELREAQKKYVEQQGQRDASERMQQAYRADAVAFSRDTPDFKDAYSYLIDGRHRELELMGMADQAERNGFIAQEERGIVAQAMQKRLSPSQMIYKLAQARGYAKKADVAPVAAPAVPEQKAEVKAEAKPAAAQQQDPAQKVAAIAAAQKAAGSSLSNAGGSSGDGLTSDSLANMSEEEFISMAARLGKSKMRQLMGG